MVKRGEVPHLPRSFRKFSTEKQRGVFMGAAFAECAKCNFAAAIETCGEFFDQAVKHNTKLSSSDVVKAYENITEIVECAMEGLSRAEGFSDEHKIKVSEEIIALYEKIDNEIEERLAPEELAQPIAAVG